MWVKDILLQSLKPILQGQKRCGRLGDVSAPSVERQPAGSPEKDWLSGASYSPLDKLFDISGLPHL